MRFRQVGHHEILRTEPEGARSLVPPPLCPELPVRLGRSLERPLESVAAALGWLDVTSRFMLGKDLWLCS